MKFRKLWSSSTHGYAHRSAHSIFTSRVEWSNLVATKIYSGGKLIRIAAKDNRHWGIRTRAQLTRAVDRGLIHFSDMMFKP